MTIVALLLCFAESALLVYLLNWLVLRSWRQTAGKHWAVRAQALYPVRTSAALHAVYGPMLVTIANVALWPQIHADLALLGAAYAGALANGYLWRKEIYPGEPFWPFLIGTPLILYFLVGFLIITVVSAVVMPPVLGPRLVLVTAIYVALQVLTFTKLDFWLLRRVGVLRSAPPRLQAIVDEVAARMATPVALTLMMPSASANAFAIPHRRQLIFTHRLVAHFSEEEIKSICAHEVGHLRQKRMFLSRLLWQRLGLTPFVFLKPLVHYFGPLGLLAPVVTFFLAVYFTRGIGRRMETEADQAAVEHGGNPAVYAHTLEHIYRLNQTSAVMPNSRRRAHPDLYDRMIEAGVTPDFPRPPPPKKFCKISYILVVALGIVTGWMMINFLDPTSFS